MALTHLLLAAMLAVDPASSQGAPAQAADAPVTPDEAEAMRDYAQGVTRRLEQSTSVRERALGSAIAIMAPYDTWAVTDRRTSLRKAAESAPGDALLQYLAPTLVKNDCVVDADCDRMKQSPARIEPDNGLAWIIAIGNSRDERTVSEKLERAAAATRFDDHLADGLDAFIGVTGLEPVPTALLREELPAQSASAGMAYMFASMSTPSEVVHQTAVLCMRLDEPLPPGRPETCARLGRAIMRHATSLDTRLAGYRYVGQAMRSPEDEAMRRSILWRRHALEQMQGAGNVDRFIADLRSTRSESKAVEAFMERKRIAPEPPADWVPDQNDE